MRPPQLALLAEAMDTLSDGTLTGKRTQRLDSGFLASRGYANEHSW
jgi:hypothetical protein